jgi:hypothetical protein
MDHEATAMKLASKIADWSLWLAMMAAAVMVIAHAAPKLFDDEPYVHIPEFGRVPLDLGTCKGLDGWRWHIVIELRHNLVATCTSYQVAR